MIVGIEHIGIAIKSLGLSNEIFAKLLGVSSYKTETVFSEKLSTSFFKVGNAKLELLESTSQESAISKFIEKRNEGIHHIALEVDNIENEMLRLKSEGFTLLNEKPKEGADNKLICFIHPKDTNGVLIELCQSINK